MRNAEVVRRIIRACFLGGSIITYGTQNLFGLSSAFYRMKERGQFH